MMRVANRKRAVVWIAACILLGCTSREGDAVADPFDEAGEESERFENRLARETSPYLLLHAHNPVDWYPWGPEAFEKARSEEKPIFLSIGYSSCYWCHVMERKVFSDPEIARYMNEHFVNVKVDREERPDVDDIYMTALTVYYQAIGSPQGGGWPLSMFLTPDGKPFAGGTYFPPDDSGGRTGFPTVMARIAELWENRRDELESNAEIITSEVQRVMRPGFSLEPASPERALVEQAVAALKESADPEYGGLDFNPARPDGPKFPVPAKLALLQYEAEHHGDDEARRIVALTLDQMALGGIRDHLGGGFHRYSTDRRWNVPHFEKMLYDQAQLAAAYTTAYKQTGKEDYRRVARGIFGFVADELTDPQGGFYSALDAETEGVEGEYYVWSFAEIEKVLSDEDAELFCRIYGVVESPAFEHGNVLRLSQPLSAWAEEVEIAEDELRRRLTGIRRRLLAVRRERETPLRDDKVLTSWNGLMIGAYAQAAAVFERNDYLEAAEKAALFVLAQMRDDEGRLLRTWRSERARLNAYLDDYAFLISGLLDLYDTTRDDKWLNAARRLMDDQRRLFRDEEGAGYFFTAHHHEELLARTKNAYDAVLPSGNSVTVRNLVRLHALTEEQDYLDEAASVLELFAPNLAQSPRGMANMAWALAAYLDAAGDHAAAGKDASQSEIEPSDSTDDAVIPVAAEEPADKLKNDEVVTARAYLSVDRLPAGRSCRFLVKLAIKPGWHINTNPANPDFLIPTTIKVTSKHGTKLPKLTFPKGKTLKVAGIDEPLHCYTKAVEVRGVIETPAAAAGKTEELQIAVRYQPCNDAKCLPPKTIKLVGKLAVAPEGEPVRQINQKLFPPERTPGR